MSVDQQILAIVVVAGVVLATGLSLWRALLRPTPGGAILLNSVAYLIGASIVAFRHGSEDAVFVLKICVVLVPVYLVSYFWFGSAFSLRRSAAVPIQAVNMPQPRGLTGKWVFFLLCTALVVFAVMATGTDRLLAALYQFVVLGDTSVSVLEMRLSFTSGEDQWLAPGYVKQLRDVLMPLAALLVLFSARRSRARFYGLSLVIVPIVTLLMISSGERGPVSLFLLATIYCAFLAVRLNIHRFGTMLFPAAFVGLVGLVAFTSLTASFTSRDYGSTPMVLILADRVVTRAPEENVDGAPAWRGGAPFLGAGWLSELGSVLPGTQETLSNLIHEDLGGGARGNSVLGLWVDVFYNFGWLFSVPIAVILGLLVAVLNDWVIRLSSVSPAAAICATWLSVTMLMVMSPFGFLLYGPFVLCAILVLLVRLHVVRMVAATSRSQPVAQE